MQNIYDLVIHDVGIKECIAVGYLRIRQRSFACLRRQVKDFSLLG